MMTPELIQYIAGMLGLRPDQVRNTIDLLDDGATVPFISRYRKERTGSLDEVQIGLIKDEKARLEELLKRKDTILKTIEELGLLTAELKNRIVACLDAKAKNKSKPCPRKGFGASRKNYHEAAGARVGKSCACLCEK